MADPDKTIRIPATFVPSVNLPTPTITPTRVADPGGSPGSPGGNIPAQQPDGTALSPLANNGIKDSQGKLTQDVNEARQAADARKEQIGTLEGQIQEAKANGADEAKVQEMQEKLDQLNLEQKTAEQQLTELQSRMDALKGSGDLTPEEAKALEEKLGGLKGVDGQNGEKLTNLQQQLDEMKKKPEDQKPEEEQQAEENQQPEEAQQQEEQQQAQNEEQPQEAQAPEQAQDQQNQEKDWDTTLSQDAQAVIQELGGGQQQGQPGQGNVAEWNWMRYQPGQPNAAPAQQQVPVGGTAPVAPPGGAPGAPPQQGNAAVAQLLAGKSPAVQQLGNDFVQASQSGVQLKPETQQLVTQAFQMAGVNPDQLLQAAQAANQQGAAGNQPPGKVNPTAGLLGAPGAKKV
ncbi:MAG: hypothetical protein HYU64_08155 [Armatimonadetes bacterium]|nr:hypothetical protein [Armatimonadota bacterium]